MSQMAGESQNIIRHDLIGDGSRGGTASPLLSAIQSYDGKMLFKSFNLGLEAVAGLHPTVKEIHDRARSRNVEIKCNVGPFEFLTCGCNIRCKNCNKNANRTYFITDLFNGNI